MILPILVIAPSHHRGRGVFASEPIPAGTVIEISPILELTAAERTEVEKTILYNYIFEWKDGACIALGYLSLYNHAYDANCDYVMEYETDTMSITTLRDIEKGEELYINYNAIPDDATPIWFEAE